MKASIIGVVVLMILSIFSGAAIAEPIEAAPNNSGIEPNVGITGTDNHQITGPSSLPVGSVGSYTYYSGQVSYPETNVRGHRFNLLWDTAYLSTYSLSYSSSITPSGVSAGPGSFELDFYPNQYINYVYLYGDLKANQRGTTTVKGQHTVDIELWPDTVHPSPWTTTIY